MIITSVIFRIDTKSKMLNVKTDWVLFIETLYYLNLQLGHEKSTLKLNQAFFAG